MEQDVKPVRTLMGRLPHGADLLEALTDLAHREGVKLAHIEALGAVKRARVGYFNQTKRVYGHLDFPHAMEILNLTGNVSLKDGEPFVHAHVTLADESGHAFGGHLVPGTIIFACEFVLHVFDGEALERKSDKRTGLALWDPDP